MAITVKVLNMSGSEVGSVELNENIFGVEVNEHVMHQAVVQYLANQRQGTKSAKTRAEVRGGGRKPWRQKGTGRARQGSIRSPQWTGGGVVFAPKPRDFSFKLNKKVKRLALKSALTTKVNNEKFVVVDELKLNEIKTKEMKKVLDNLNVNKGLVVLEENNKNVLLSARNIPNVKTAGVNTINVYDILKYESFVVTKEALAKIEEVYK
ncbi:50S ribosomal protein L4 [uncultured Tyzzerella sp.]|uniref:50S ribosomal protein L4 n=1 Tax=uncultured Tyzzerella sp. TaxID=2321398 RepID=UPI002942B643|nr:50S ribosomal protein L4 [uncultured Tyzzerella sp.]